MKINMLKFLRDFKHSIKWRYELLLFSKRSRSHLFPRLPEDKYLLLVPHSDDEWMTNSCMLNRKNVVVVNLDMLGGDSTELHQIRRSELKTTCLKYNRKLITVDKNKVVVMSKILEKELPATVVVPFFVDWHSEHLEVIKILHDSLRSLNNLKMPKVCMYSVSCPMPYEAITHIEPMNRYEWKKKWKYFFQHYVTQRSIPFKRFAYCDRFVGKIGNVFSGEAYRIVDVSEWYREFDSIKLNVRDICLLKNNLGSIISLYETSNSIYKQLY